MLDRLFDIMNSRSPVGKGFKAPLSMDNWEETLSFLKVAKAYLLSLTREDGTPLYRTKKYFFLLAGILFFCVTG